MTDATGRFEGDFPVYSLPIVLIVIDYERNIGGFTVVTETTAKNDIEIVVGPLARISFEQRIDGAPPGWMGMVVRLHQSNLQVVFSGDVHAGSLRLPAGSYQLDVYSLDTEPFRRDLTTKYGQLLDLGVIDIKLTGLGKSYGKEAPELSIGEARGLEPGFTLEELKGKWILLEFWGFW